MKKSIVLFSVILLLAGCAKDPKKPGKIYMPDMTYSNAYETYSPSEVKTPEGYGMSARLPVAGTIPRGFIPADPAIRNNQAFLMGYMAKKYFTGVDTVWQAEYEKAGQMIKNPLPASEENLAAGKAIYQINCQVCHGVKGEGNGQIVELPDGSDGPYGARPPAYATRLKEITEGNMFYSVSFGKGMMGGYGPQLSVNERWQVIHYIKNLAGLTTAAPATTDSAATKQN